MIAGVRRSSAVREQQALVPAVVCILQQPRQTPIEQVRHAGTSEPCQAQQLQQCQMHALCCPLQSEQTLKPAAHPHGGVHAHVGGHAAQDDIAHARRRQQQLQVCRGHKNGVSRSCNAGRCC